MSWGIAGTQVLVNGARQLVQQKIKDVAIDEAVKRAFEQVKKRLFLILLVPMLELLKIALPTGGTSGGHKVAGFLKGFLEGFIEDAFSSIFDRWNFVLRLEPRSWRAVKLIMKIQGILA